MNESLVSQAFARYSGVQSLRAYARVSVLALCRDDWHADLRSTRSKLAQAEQLARAKESEVEDLRKAYEVLPDHHHQIACLAFNAICWCRCWIKSCVLPGSVNRKCCSLPVGLLRRRYSSYWQAQAAELPICLLLLITLLRTFRACAVLYG